jgi:hypothetical protein
LPTSFLQLFSFWQRKKLIKSPIFCDEILSEATEVTSSGMTVGSGGLNADRAKYYALLHALSLSRLRDSSLPEGAFDGGGRRFARFFVRKSKFLSEN